jgi:hypothetical protein
MERNTHDPETHVTVIRDVRELEAWDRLPLRSVENVADHGAYPTREGHVCAAPRQGKLRPYGRLLGGGAKISIGFGSGACFVAGLGSRAGVGAAALVAVGCTFAGAGAALGTSGSSSRDCSM